MITLSGVSKRYGDVWAVRDVSFTVRAGEVLGLLGQNGAGKTTTLNIMTGYLAPSEGNVTVNGFDVQLKPRQARQYIGYLPETPPLYEEMTVGAYLRFACELKRVSAPDIPESVLRAARETGIADILSRRIGNLSKGYRQRVGLAQALCGEPAVLVLDEPTSGLDPRQTVEFRQTLRRQAQERTVIFSSHILSEVQQLCDRVLILHHGKIMCDTPLHTLESGGAKRLKAEILSTDAHLLPALRSLSSVQRVTRLPASQAGVTTVLLECRAGSVPQRELFTLLCGLNAPLLSLNEAQTTLEEAFLHYTAQE